MGNTDSNIIIPEVELNTEGFTPSGKIHYYKTLKDYSQTLFDKAISYADKAQVREVTHNDVRNAAHSIANTFGIPLIQKWVIFLSLGKF